MPLELKRVLVTDPIQEEFTTALRAAGLDVVEQKLTKEELLEHIPNYDALVVRSATKVSKDVIEKGKNLKIIGRAGVGVDNIDVDAATKNGVIVMNSPAGSTVSAAEQTCTLILAQSRFTAQASASLKSGKWTPKAFMGNEVFEKTLAVIGLGRIGCEVANRMRAFGMKTIGYDAFVTPEQAKQRGIDFKTLDEIWPLADVITVHTPLLPETKNLICAQTLAKCKKGVKIVNVARGGIINESDLLNALNDGIVSTAGLDVFETEPPTNTQLIEHPNVVCTPHLGASTKEGQRRIAAVLGKQIVDLVQGRATLGVLNGTPTGEVKQN